MGLVTVVALRAAQEVGAVRVRRFLLGGRNTIITRASKVLWFQGVKFVIYSVMAFAAILFVTVEYGEQVKKVNWSMASIMGMAVFGVYMFFRWTSNPNNTFEPLDMVLDPITR